MTFDVKRELEELTLLIASIVRITTDDNDAVEVHGLANMAWDRAVGLQHDVMQALDDSAPAAEVRQ